MSAVSSSTIHQQFEAALPAIVAAAAFAFRNRRRQEREDAIAEVRAAAWSAWHGLLARGQDPLAIGIWGIAANACRYVQNGRKIGNGNRGGRGAMDVHHPRAQKRDGFRVISLDSLAEPGSGRAPGTWREWLAENNRVSPADEACFRADFQVWLDGLPARKRAMAELLAQGHETGVVATTLGVTPGAVSQSRTWLAARWQAFQGEAVVNV